MLKKRIIPCLDIKDGRAVKGIGFKNLKDAGCPIELAKQYVSEGADELVFLDISATEEKRKTLTKLVEQMARHINIPFTVGGGIASAEDVKQLLDAGADKIGINSSAVRQPALISELATKFGNQCIVVSIDTKQEKEGWKVFIQGGKIPTKLDAVEWAKKVESLGAGEILLTSISNDGEQNGFGIDITQKLAQSINIPIIASGGAGEMIHFKEVFEKTDASGALAASIFHFQKISIPTLKKYLRKEKISVRWI